MNFPDLGNIEKIISLGRVCYSRSHPSRFLIYNYKLDKVRMPFDGCTTSYEAMCNEIKTDFLNFDKDLEVEGNEIVNTKSKIRYSHEETLDIENIRAQLILRKNQFISSLQNAKSIIVFFLTHNNYPSEIINIIQTKYPNLKFKIFTLDWSIYETEKCIIDDPLCTYINIPFPSETYSEWRDRETPIGYIYEKKVLTEFLKFLTKITGNSYDMEVHFEKRTNPY